MFTEAHHWTIWFRLQAGAGNFSLRKAAGGVNLPTDLHLRAEMKNAWSTTFIPQYTFVAWCLIKE
jgi:hypothetical protein